MARGQYRQALTLGLLILGACRSGPEQRAPLAPAPPPVPLLARPAVPPQHPAPSAEIRLVSAIEPIPPLETPRPAQQELIPAPVQSVHPPLRLTLFDAVELGLMQNPDLAALRTAEGVSEGALGVAQTYPFNPWVQIQVTPLQESAVSNTGPVNHYVLLQQQLQLAHQRSHRTAAAAALLNSVRWNYVQAKLVHVAQTQRLYFAALYQQELANLARAQADLSAQSRAIAERQFAAGQIAGADAAILKLDSAGAIRQAALAATNAQTALLDLQRHLGLPLAVPVELTDRLANWQWEEVSGACPTWTRFIELEISSAQDQSTLARSLVSGRPDVWAACADVDAARANLDLARANRIPDLIIGPYYQRNNDPTTFFGLRAQVDLPVLNTGAPLVRQRIAELTQRQAIWQQLFNRATLEAEAAIDRYDRALRIAGELETAMSDDTPIELQRLEQQFQAGEVDLLRIIAARASLFLARRATLDCQNELAQASAALIAATGVPPAALLSPRAAK